MIPNLWNSIIRTDVAIIISKMDSVRLLYMCILLEVGTTTLKAHLMALQEAGARPLRGICWHFTHVLLDTETRLLQATGLVAVDPVLAGSPTPVVQRVE